MFPTPRSTVAVVSLLVTLAVQGGSCPFFISQMFHLWVGNWRHTNSNLPRVLAVIKIYVEEAFNSDVKQS